MAAWGAPQGPFDIPDVPGFVPRRLKPWLFIFFVLIIQFSGGLYLAAVTDMVGTTALMQEDILMAGYASLIGMSINFCVMFRFKFRFTNRTQLILVGYGHARPWAIFPKWSTVRRSIWQFVRTVNRERP